MDAGQNRGDMSIPWRERMRRIVNRAGGRDEWLAPDDVITVARRHYLEAIEWLQECALLPLKLQQSQAHTFLTSVRLKRFAQILHQTAREARPLCFGVLRCDHLLTLRTFNEEGDRCLVLDQQTERRMATYDASTGQRVFTQQLPDSVTVYALAYDAADQRWKIGAYLQDLPVSWNAGPQAMQEFHSIPAFKGRG